MVRFFIRTQWKRRRGLRYWYSLGCLELLNVVIDSKNVKSFLALSIKCFLFDHLHYKLCINMHTVYIQLCTAQRRNDCLKENCSAKKQALTHEKHSARDDHFFRKVETHSPMILCKRELIQLRSKGAVVSSNTVDLSRRLTHHLGLKYWINASFVGSF